MRRLGIAALLALVASCASVPHRAASREPSLRSRVVRSARGMIGEQSLSLGGRALPADCLSLPRAAYGENGIELGAPTAAALYSKVRRDGHWFSHGTPRRADLVFVRDAAGGSLHVGLVEDVERDGTVIVLQRMARGVTAYRMNPRHPRDAHAPEDPKPWNDTLSGRGESAPAGALFSGYASLLP